MMAERGPVLAQMLPGQNSPQNLKSDDMIDRDPFHAVIANGKEEGIEGVAQCGNSARDVFGDQAGRGAGAVCPQDVTGKKNEQGHGERRGQPDPLATTIGVRAFKNGPEMDNGEQKEQLAGIEMERAERVAKRNKQIKRTG